MTIPPHRLTACGRLTDLTRIGCSGRSLTLALLLLFNLVFNPGFFSHRSRATATSTAA